MNYPLLCYLALGAAAAVALIALLRTGRPLGHLIVTLGGAVIIVAAAGCLLLWTQGHYREQQDDAVNTLDAQRRVMRVNSVATHAESGQRGYILTGDPDYLTSFTDAKAQLAPELSGLRASLPSELGAIGDRLAGAIADKMRELDATVAAYRTGGSADSLAIVRSDTGLRLARSIDATCAELMARLDARLGRELRHSTIVEWLVTYGGSGLLLLALLTILAASRTSTHLYRQRASADAARDQRSVLLELAGEAGSVGHWKVIFGAAPVVEWSKATFGMHGRDVTRGAPPLAEAIDYFIPEDRQRVADAVGRAITCGEGFQFEARLRSEDGRVLDVLSRGAVSFGEDGKAASLYGVLIDLSPVRQAERELAHSDARHRLLAETLPGIVFMLRADDLHLIYGNRRFFDCFGPRTARFEDRRGRYHPNSAAIMENAWRSVAASGADSFEAEVQIADEDGGYRWHKLVAMAVGRDGPRREWIVNATDIDAILGAKQELEESQKLLKLSLAAAGASTWSLTVATRTLHFSAEVAHLYGFAAVARDLDIERDWVPLVDPNDVARTIEVMKAASLDGRVLEAEFRVKRPDGAWRWIFVTGHGERDAGGAVFRLIGLAQDVTRRKTIEAELFAAGEAAESARRQAESANQAKTDFLAAMSHEIRTPLNSILGFTDLMLSRGELTGEPRHYAEIINSSGSALLTVINDILDFSKIEAGRIEIDDAPFSPRALFANAVSIVRGLAVSKGLELTAAIDPAVPEGLSGDAARIQQVLMNLLNNAIKFTPAGSVSLRVRLEAVEAGVARLRIAVTDSGIGIAKAKQDRLFKRFSQADSSISGQYGGSGLGLAISKRLVELMCGEIGVFSDEGKGATFWFTLSLPVASFTTRRTAIDSSKPTMTGRLLLVEDVEVNQLLARTLLEDDGHVVDIVGSGEEAIAAVQAKAYDLVLMDVQMPGMDGIAATRAIRALPGYGKLPIIAMTANVLREQVQSFLTAGMNDHIGKPIARADMRAAIALWLGARNARAPSRDPLEPDTFAIMATMLGADKTRDILVKFKDELDKRLRPDDLVAASRRTFQDDAHVIAASAGMLGFADLARQCIGIVEAALDDAETFERRGIDLVRAKTHALGKIATLMAQALPADAGADVVVLRAADAHARDHVHASARNR